MLSQTSEYPIVYSRMINMLKKILKIRLFFFLGSNLIAPYALCENIAPSQFFDLPALPLKDSILEFAFQANCEIVAQEIDIKNIQGKPIFGYQQPLMALQQIIANTDLVSEYNSESKLYIIRTSKTKPILLAPVQKIEPIQEVIVTGIRYPMRYQTIINSESRYGNAMFDTSRVHNILPHAVLKDAGSDNLVEALKYISSSTQGDGFMASNDDYFIRGFPRQNTYINGLRISKNTAMQIMPDNIEHIDVLKGPTMLFYGQSSAGGVVDVARKQPSSSDSVEMEALTGQFGRQKVRVLGNKANVASSGIDLLVSAIDDRAYESLDINQSRRQVITARGEGQWSQNLTVNLGFEHQYLNKNTAADLPLIDENGQFLPYRGNSFLNQANDTFAADINLLDGSVSYNFAPQWRIQGNFLLQHEVHSGIRTNSEFLADAHILLVRDDDYPREGIATIIGQMAAPIVRSGFTYAFANLESVFDQFERQRTYTSSIDLNGRFKFAGCEQQIVIGVDIYDESLAQDFAIEERVFTHPQVYSRSILTSPQSTLREAILNDAPVTLGITPSSWNITREDWGSYLQLKSSWTETWSTSIGGRYSRFYDTSRQIGGTNPDLEGRYEDWILQVGTSLQLKEQLSIYANYAETLNLNYLIDDFERFVERPEKSTQQELGVKWAGWDDRAIGTLSLFNIESVNISSIQFESGYRTLQDPQRRQARGVELDLTWRTTDWLELIASTSFAHNFISQPNHLLLRYPRLVADNTAGLFARISFPRQWAGFIGMNYVSDRSVDGSGELTLGEYLGVDMSIAKQFTFDNGKWSIRASIKNILDNYQPASAIPDLRVSPNQGRRTALGVNYML